MSQTKTSSYQEVIQPVIAHIKDVLRKEMKDLEFQLHRNDRILKIKGLPYSLAVGGAKLAKWHYGDTSWQNYGLPVYFKIQKPTQHEFVDGKQKTSGGQIRVYNLSIELKAKDFLVEEKFKEKLKPLIETIRTIIQNSRHEEAGEWPHVEITNWRNRGPVRVTRQ